MLLYDRNIIGPSSEIFGNLRKVFGDFRLTFGQILENHRKSSESGRKSSKTSLLVYLYNKQNIRCPIVDTNFIFSCSTRYRVEQEKIKLISTRGHVISSISHLNNMRLLNTSSVYLFPERGRKKWCFPVKCLLQRHYTRIAKERPQYKFRHRFEI